MTHSKLQEYSNELYCVRNPNCIEWLPIPFNLSLIVLNIVQVDKFIDEAHLQINTFILICKSRKGRDCGKLLSLRVENKKGDKQSNYRLQRKCKNTKSIILRNHSFVLKFSIKATKNRDILQIFFILS